MQSRIMGRGFTVSLLSLGHSSLRGQAVPAPRARVRWRRPVDRGTARSEGVGADDLAQIAGAQPPVDVAVDRLFDCRDAAVAEEELDDPGVHAPEAEAGHPVRAAV